MAQVHEQKMRRPYGNGSVHRLQSPRKKMRCIVKHISGIVGAEDGDVVVNGLFPDEKQLQPVEDGDCQAVIADSVNPEQGEIVVRDSQGNSAEPTPADNSAYERKCGDSPLLRPHSGGGMFVVAWAWCTQAKESTIPILRSNVLSKWTRKYFRFKLWLMEPSVARKTRNIPNWWIDLHKLDLPRKARDTIAGMPRSVAETVDRAQKACTAGNAAATERAEASQGATKLKRSMVRAMDTYNESAAKLRKTVE